MKANVTDSGKKKLSKEQIKNILQNSSIYIILFLLIIFVIIKEPNFLSFRVFSQILSQASTRIIIALGVAGIIITGGMDVSAGRSVGMAAIITASLLQTVGASQRIFADMPRLPVFLPILLAMVICMVFSVMNGIVVSKLKVAPYISALGFQLVIYGAMSLYYDKINGGSPIGSLDEKFKNFAQGTLTIGSISIPRIILYAFACAILIWFIWNKTRLGKNMYAIGGNLEAATVSGVNVLFNTLIMYAIGGALYGFAGALEVARTGSATNALGAEYATDAIAACAVGGISMRGGIGKVSGVIIGVLLFQVVNYGLIFVGVNAYLQYTVRGLIILLAVIIDTQKFVKKK